MYPSAAAARSWASLPEDCLAIVAQHLSTDDAAAVRLVCKSWRNTPTAGDTARAPAVKTMRPGVLFTVTARQSDLRILQLDGIQFHDGDLRPLARCCSLNALSLAHCHLAVRAACSARQNC